MSELVTASVIVGVTALASAVATPLFGTAARGMGLLARPRTDRWGAAAIPLLGGAGIALAALSAIALFMPTGQLSWTILAAAGAAFALGLIDDFRHLAPTTKLVGQVFVAGILVVGDVQVRIVEEPAVAFVLTVFWVVGMMNAVNLMDNMDGLAAGVAAIAATVLSLTALDGTPGSFMLSAATVGASVGFLLHNFPPARIFMGDAGSQLLGLLLATAALLHTASGAANVGLALLGPLAALALPIFDTMLVVISRRLAGSPVGRGGRDHTSHRLASLGMSDRSVVLTLYGVAAALALLGFLADAYTNAVIPLVAVAVIALVLFATFLLGIEIDSRTTARLAHVQDPSGVLRAMSSLGRFGAEVGVDVVLLTSAYFTAFLIRFEGVPESSWMPLFVRSVPIVIGLQLASLVGLRVYRTLWRFFVVSDALAIIRALTLGTGLAVLALVVLFRFEGFSRAVFIIDWLLAATLIIGARTFWLWLRHTLSLLPREGDTPVVIVGATDNGAIALRLLQSARTVRYRPVGFLDDDPGKRYRRIGGTPVVGTVADAEEVLERYRAKLVILATTEPHTVDRIRAACDRAGIECRDFTQSM